MNVRKTEIVIFRPRQAAHPTFTYKGATITVSKRFKYLGVVFEATGNMETAVSARAAAAVSAFHLFVRRGTAWMMTAKLSERLYRIYIRTVLSYGCEMWVVEKWQPLEVVQQRVALHVLGIQRALSYASVYSEVGWLPFQAFTTSRVTRFWLSVGRRSSTGADVLLHSALKAQIAMSKKENAQCWLKGVYGTLRERVGGEAERFIAAVETAVLHQQPLVGEDIVATEGGRESRERWENTLERSLDSSFLREQQAALQEASKTRLYARLVRGTVRERAGYLEDDSIRREQRAALARIRLGGAPLMIERGRHMQRKMTVRGSDGEVVSTSHPSVPSHARFCPMCAQAVEDEAHFFCECPSYRTMRLSVLPTACTEAGERAELAYVRLMEEAAAKPPLWKAVARFAYLALQLREETLHASTS